MAEMPSFWRWFLDPRSRRKLRDDFNLEIRLIDQLLRELNERDAGFSE